MRLLAPATLISSFKNGSGFVSHDDEEGFANW